MQTAQEQSLVKGLDMYMACVQHTLEAGGSACAAAPEILYEIIGSHLTKDIHSHAVKKISQVNKAPKQGIKAHASHTSRSRQTHLPSPDCDDMGSS